MKNVKLKRNINNIFIFIPRSNLLYSFPIMIYAKLDLFRGIGDEKEKSGAYK
jgi:hypothetical protein